MELTKPLLVGWEGKLEREGVLEVVHEVVREPGGFGPVEGIGCCAGRDGEEPGAEVDLGFAVELLKGGLDVLEGGRHCCFAPVVVEKLGVP